MTGFMVHPEQPVVFTVTQMKPFQCLCFRGHQKTSKLARFVQIFKFFQSIGVTRVIYSLNHINSKGDADEEKITRGATNGATTEKKSHLTETEELNDD